MVDGIHVLDQLQNLVGVADLVVVPGNDLDEGVGQSDAGQNTQTKTITIRWSFFVCLFI